MSRLRAFLVLASVLAFPSVAGAHGGEDHGEPQPVAASGASADGKRTASGQTNQFELLLKFAPPAPGKDASFAVFLADYATNAPVENAKIELELTGPQSAKVTAEPAGAPGTYHAVAKLPPGSYALVATIEGSGQLDLVDIPTIDLTPAAATASKTDEHAHAAVPWTGIAAGAGALVIIALALVIFRRRAARGRVPTSAALLLLVLGLPVVARSHGGEDHGEPQPAKSGSPSVPAGSVYMAKESQFLLGVRTVVAREREMEARVAAVGRVIPRIDAHAAIAAPQPGRIVTMPGRALPFIGDKVKKGQALLVIEQTLGAADTGAMKSQAIAARAAAAQARARRDQAQRELERRRSLEGVVAQKEIQQAELELELTRRELELAEQQTSLFGGTGLQRITLTAPIDGTIVEANVSIGEQVAADQALYTIIDPATLWVEASVFETDVPKIEQAGAADIRVDGYDTAFVGKVYRIGQIVDPTTRTVKVILMVDNAKGTLRPGMFAEVAVAAGQRATALAVPDAAVIEESGRRFVNVHVAPEEFARREVVLGARDVDDWAVKSGLKKGERVVTQGTYQLRTTR